MLQRYGWSAEFSKDDDTGYWTCTVTVARNDRRRFVSNDKSPETIAGQKLGQMAASAVALEGLKSEIEKQERKPVKELAQVFPERIDVYESNEENWRYFWNHKPAIVGIDVEGNQLAPPVLVQIATDKYTIIEAPRGKISTDLERLLRDESIVKVFCDNFGHKDKKCLGINKISEDLTDGHLVDLEAVTAKLLGPVSVARGLSRIVTLSMPELDVLIRKPKSQGRFANVGRFALIEQGKAPPLNSVWDLSDKERQYAALDAWCTLYAYKRFQQVTAESARLRTG